MADLLPFSTRRLGRSVSGPPAVLVRRMRFECPHPRQWRRNWPCVRRGARCFLIMLPTHSNESLGLCKDAELVASCGLEGTRGFGSRAASPAPRGCSAAWVVFCAYDRDSEAWSSPAPREATVELSGLCSSDQRVLAMLSAVSKRSLRLAHDTCARCRELLCVSEAATRGGERERRLWIRRKRRSLE